MSLAEDAFNTAKKMGGEVAHLFGLGKAADLSGPHAESEAVLRFLRGLQSESHGLLRLIPSLFLFAFFIVLATSVQDVPAASEANAHLRHAFFESLGAEGVDDAEAIHEYVTAQLLPMLQVRAPPRPPPPPP